MTPLSILAAVSLAASAAPAAPLQPGTYVYENGAGSLTLKPAKGGSLSFSIETMGGNAHTCGLSGEFQGNKATLTDGAESPCVVRFDAIEKGVDVTAETSESCRAFCGMRASFEGKYVQPDKECLSTTVDKTRSKFKKLYDQKKFPEALALLEPTLKCEPVIDRFTTMWIRNDLAVTYHALKNDQACLKVLEPMKELAADEEPGGGEPSFKDILEKIAKASRYNLKLCTTPTK
jgi:hypothetical protein